MSIIEIAATTYVASTALRLVLGAIRFIVKTKRAAGAMAAQVGDVLMDAEGRMYVVTTAMDERLKRLAPMDAGMMVGPGWTMTVITKGLRKIADGGAK